MEKKIILCKNYDDITWFDGTVGLWWVLKSPPLAKIPAISQNISGKVWGPLTIWARQNLQLLTSFWSCWRALVQILVDVLPLRHVDLKWSDGSGRSAFMGGVSPVLYRLVVPARLAKIHVGVQISTGCANFHHFLWKLKNSISASKCPITAPKIRTWSLLVSKFSYHTQSPKWRPSSTLSEAAKICP